MLVCQNALFRLDSLDISGNINTNFIIIIVSLE